MKKQFKWMFFFLSMTVSLITLSACGGSDSGDDEEEVIIDNRIIGTWVWGETGVYDPTAHHAARYIFSKNGYCEFEEYWNDTEKLQTKKTGTFTVDGTSLTIFWSSIIKDLDLPLGDSSIDLIEIVYPASGDSGMFFKRKTSNGGTSEEGPFTKAK